MFLSLISTGPGFSASMAHASRNAGCRRSSARGIKGDLNLRENPCIADNLFVVMAYCSFISLIAEVRALTLGELYTDVSLANGRASDVGLP